MTAMIDPHHIYNVIYNPRTNRNHNSTSPNTAPATQNESHDWPASHIKRHLQCAEQQESQPNFTKHCACHAKEISWLTRVTYEISCTMLGPTNIKRQVHEILHPTSEPGIEPRTSCFQGHPRGKFSGATILTIFGEMETELSCSERVVSCLPLRSTKPNLPGGKKRKNFKEEQHFKRSSLSQQLCSAALPSSYSQQLFSAAFLSSSSQQLFSAALLSSLSQQLFSAAFFSSSSQQLFSAAFLSSSSQQLLSAIILLWSGVGGQLAAFLSRFSQRLWGWWSSKHPFFRRTLSQRFREKTQTESTERKHRQKRQREDTDRKHTHRKHTQKTQRENTQKTPTENTQTHTLRLCTTKYYTALHVGAGNRAQDLLLPRLTPYLRGKFSGTTIFKRLW